MRRRPPGPPPWYYATDAQVAYLRRLCHEADRRPALRDVYYPEAHRVDTTWPRENVARHIDRLRRLLGR